ncbi:hypothetical protein OV090_04210 [Nannocystis sp. RBIL2]|uniref:hypothetical protein n=1 Tax=Nannocystis sp. RBIL2 TaxID=2996788 RepID=UPI00226EAD01|nr:hypothetical protein [Nannocystis sp. RBIL2]MCY1063951.1 hypothetical protein [Nannocystis sp. RBIL2]
MTPHRHPLSLRLALALLVVACGPQVPMTTDSTGSTQDSSGSTTSTTSGPSTTSSTATTTTASPTTTTVDPDPGTSSASSEGGTFITPPDGGGCVAGFGGQQARCSSCDPWSQNCPEGQKCVPASNDGGDVWHTTACVPLAPDPAQAGELCTIEQNSTRLIDTCDEQSICLGTDPDTQEPACIPLCQGGPEAPECPAGSACVIGNQGVLIPCQPTCDPLENTCPDGHLCRLNFSDPDNFVCFPMPSDGLANLFEACDDTFECAAGLSCEEAVFGGECDPDQSERCCLAYCDLDAPSCPLVGDVCVPLFADDPPPDWAHLGVCREP